MEIFKYTDLDNGDILLEKIILNPANYIIKNKNNGDKILKKIITVNINKLYDIKKYDFSKSNILYCLLNNIALIK